MRTNPFKGYGVALVTPFLENGDVDYAALSRLVDFQIDNGADFICAMGTTAETPTLDEDEYQQVLRTIVKCVDGRVPIMAGCSDNCTARLVRRLQNNCFDGVSAVLSCVPSYNKPSQNGVYQHFMAVAEASPLPIVLYNVPGRTGIDMLPETTLSLARDSQKFIAIKEASGNVAHIRQLISEAPSGFEVISGDDSLTFELMQYGAVGVISVIGNAIPQTFSRLVHNISSGDIAAARSIQEKLSSLYGLLFKEGNPCGIKALMSERGLLMNSMRLPMTAVSAELEGRIRNGFKSIGV